jgi:hypothetical protein
MTTEARLMRLVRAFDAAFGNDDLDDDVRRLRVSYGGDHVKLTIVGCGHDFEGPTTDAAIGVAESWVRTAARDAVLRRREALDLALERARKMEVELAAEG